MASIMQSVTMIYNQNENIYVPKWIIDVSKMSISMFKAKQGEYRTVNVINKYSQDHIRYLYQYDKERIQKLLDDGNIYMYICRKKRAANSTVEQQVEKWKDNDKEYRLAVETGNIQDEIGLENNFIARAEEIMYPCVIYV